MVLWQLRKLWAGNVMASPVVRTTAAKDWGQSFPFREVAARYSMGWTTKPTMRNDKGKQAYIKSREIFREFFGDKKCNVFDVQDRIAKAVAEGSSKKKFLEKGLEIGFHLTDWHEDARFLIALSLFPERFTNAEIRQGVIHHSQGATQT
jgi:hypothetical protein